MSRKEFKSFKDQIELLKSRGLNISDEPKLESYLKNFNYHNFINAYNDFFMINEDRKMNEYKQSINSDMIITLFNFDRRISGDTLPYILSIERKLSTSVTYNILNSYKEMNGYLLHGEILKLSDDDFLIIFPGIKKYDFTNKNWLNENSINKYFLKENINRFKNLMKKESIGKDLSINYLDDNEIPLWALSINWSMGFCIKVYSLLNKEIQIKIIQNFIGNLYHYVNEDFNKILYLINSIRNRICHNNVLFNIDYIKSKNKIRRFLKMNGYNSDNNIVRFNEGIFLIDLLTPFKKEIKLVTEIENELSIINTKNSNIMEPKTLDKIKKYMHFNK